MQHLFLFSLVYIYLLNFTPLAIINTNILVNHTNFTIKINFINIFKTDVTLKRLLKWDGMTKTYGNEIEKK